MMIDKKRIIFLPIALIVTFCGFFSCGVDRWPEYAEQTALDTWMYEVMEDHYLWYESLPSYNETNLFVEPATFLSNVVVSGDSYSYVDSILATPLPTYGFDYSLVRSTDVDTAYNALITYVIQDSPADQAGLQRGDWIMKVDTSYISSTYASVWLEGTEARKLVMGSWSMVITPIEDSELNDTVYTVVANGDTLDLPEAQVVEDNPVHAYSIIETPVNNIKIGYLMYNSFIAGTDSEPEKYNDALREVSVAFQEADIDAVILDLRYNTGGEVECVQLLGSILTSSNLLDTEMAYLEYNDKHSDKDTILTYDSDLLETGVNLNLSGLVAITGSVTSGAPEMLLQCLYTGYDVITVGSATNGQNVATETFESDTYQWSISPVVATIYNSDYETYEEFTPDSDLKVSETTINSVSNYYYFLPFGDVNERLLSIAIGVLDGTYPETTTSADIRIEKSYSSPASRRYVNGGGLKIK